MEQPSEGAEVNVTPKGKASKPPQFTVKAWLSSTLPRFISSALNKDFPRPPIYSQQSNFLINENVPTTHKLRRKLPQACGILWRG